MFKLEIKKLKVLIQYPMQELNAILQECDKVQGKYLQKLKLQEIKIIFQLLSLSFSFSSTA